MIKVSRLSFLLAIIFALCGFSSRFDIKVVQQGHDLPSFELSKASSIHDGGGIQVNTFLVVQRNGSEQWDYKNPVWAFELAPGSTKPLSKIIYGQVPAGFNETTKALELIHGTHYLVVGLSPGSSGSAEFVAE
jgi:hypothetical protein